MIGMNRKMMLSCDTALIAMNTTQISANARDARQSIRNSFFIRPFIVPRLPSP